MVHSEHAPSALLCGLDLWVNYQDGDNVVSLLNRLSIEVSSGELVVVTGPSGSGKSTLINRLLGLLPPAAIAAGGSVLFGGSEISSERDFARMRLKYIGYSPQDGGLIDYLSLSDNVRIAEALGGDRISQAHANEALEKLGIDHLASRLPSQVSGGERQRAAFARAIAKKVPLIVADEPTGNLDRQASESLASLAESLAHDGFGLVVASHDPTVIGIATRTVAIGPPAAGPFSQSLLEVDAR
jgi:putative ABC transport system ATP-binding protein